MMSDDAVEQSVLLTLEIREIQERLGSKKIKAAERKSLESRLAELTAKADAPRERDAAAPAPAPAASGQEPATASGQEQVAGTSRSLWKRLTRGK
jgi:hypothetical protein